MAWFHASLENLISLNYICCVTQASHAIQNYSTITSSLTTKSKEISHNFGLSHLMQVHINILDMFILGNKLYNKLQNRTFYENKWFKGVQCSHLCIKVTFKWYLNIQYSILIKIIKEVN